MEERRRKQRREIEDGKNGEGVSLVLRPLSSCETKSGIALGQGLEGVTKSLDLFLYMFTT